MILNISKKIILFGAGAYGRQALKDLGKINVHCFCDNNPILVNKTIEGIKVIGVEDLKRIDGEIEIIIAVKKSNYMDIYNQLSMYGFERCIKKYEIGTYECSGIISVVNEVKEKGLIIYGVGFWGEIAEKIFYSFNIKPICYCSDSVSNSNFNGYQVFSLEQAAEKYPNSVFIISSKDTPTNIIRNKMILDLKEYSVYTKSSQLQIENYTYLLDIDINSILDNTYSGISGEINIRDIDKIMIFNHMGHSGSFYFDNLIDGHENILNIPFGYGLERLIEVYNNRLKFLGKREMIFELCSLVNKHFETSIKLHNLDASDKLILLDYCVDKKGKKQTKIAINPELYIQYLIYEMNNIKECTLGNIIKVIYVAYSNCLCKKNNNNDKFWIFFHMHQWDFQWENNEIMFNEKDFNRIEFLFIIRNPIQHFYSFLKFKENDPWTKNLFSIQYYLDIIKNDLGLKFQSEKGLSHNVKVIKFEDIKLDFENFIIQFCKWADIKCCDSLRKTTMNDIEVYYKTYDKNGNSIYITGHNPIAVKRNNYNTYLTEYDSYRFNIAFQKFSKAYGYNVDVPDFKNMSDDYLKSIFSDNYKFIDIIPNISIKERNKLKEAIMNCIIDYIREYDDNTEYYQYINMKK